jgi:hypothetical protein
MNLFPETFYDFKAMPMNGATLRGATLRGATQAETALRQLYRDVLGRDPDPVGLNWWLSEVGEILDASERDRWMYDANLELQRRASENVFAPAGPTQAESQLRDLYASVLGRDPDAAGFDYWLSVVGDYLDEGEKAMWMAEAREELDARARAATPVVTQAPVVVTPPPTQTATVVAPPKPTPIYEPMTPKPVVSVPSTPAPAVITQAETALRQLYKDVLGRDPDLLGMNYWLTVVGDVLDENEKALWMAEAKRELSARMPTTTATPGTPTTTTTAKPTTTAAQPTQAEIALRQLYKDVLKRDPDSEGLAAWLQEVGPVLDARERELWMMGARKELAARGMTLPATATPITEGNNVGAIALAALAAAFLLGA